MIMHTWKPGLLLMLLISVAANATELKPVALKCEYRVNPLGIDEPQPRLCWRIESTQRGVTVLRTEAGSAVLSVESGKYRFVVEANR